MQARQVFRNVVTIPRGYHVRTNRLSEQSVYYIVVFSSVPIELIRKSLGISRLYKALKEYYIFRCDIRHCNFSPSYCELNSFTKEIVDIQNETINCYRTLYSILIAVMIKIKENRFTRIIKLIWYSLQIG